jgi:hypothetical protein
MSKEKEPMLITLTEAIRIYEEEEKKKKNKKKKLS